MPCDCQESYLPQECNVFLPIVSGDFYPEGLRFVLSGMDQTLEGVEIEFKADPASSTGDLMLSTENGRITIEDDTPDSWTWLVPAFEVTLPAATYFYQVKCIYGGGKIRTFITGELPVTLSI